MYKLSKSNNSAMVGTSNMEDSFSENEGIDTVMNSAPPNMNKVLVIGSGEFGNALAQGLELATFNDHSSVSVHQVSASEFFSMDQGNMMNVLAGARYIMYCGRFLNEHAHRIVGALQKAQKWSNVVDGAKNSVSQPLRQFVDWSNPDPASSNGGNEVEGLMTLAKYLNISAEDNGTINTVLWKISGVSSFDVAGHEGKQIATIYSSLPSSKKAVPAISIPGITWKKAEDPSLIGEALDRLMTRAEVDRWYDAFYISLGIFLTAFVYAFTRYSEWVNGSYPYTMVPLYIADKAISWTALWMIVVSPFAGNVLALGAICSNWKRCNAFDILMFVLGFPFVILSIGFFLIPWGVWFIIRSLFANVLYTSQVGKKSSAPIKAMLVDIVSLKHESGVVGFFFVLTHAFMGALIAMPAYKSKWFDDKGRFYGNNEVSMAFGVTAATLITAVTIRSLFGKTSWIKLKPMYTFIAPLGAFLAAMHVVMMGYSGWNKLFDYNTKKGQPSITWVSSMFPLLVLAAHLILSIFGTKKRVGKTMIWKHSSTYAAFKKYQSLKDEFVLDLGNSNVVSVYAMHATGHAAKKVNAAVESKVPDLQDVEQHSLFSGSEVSC